MKNTDQNKKISCQRHEEEINMLTKEIVMVIVTGVVLPLLTALMGYIINYINVKYKDLNSLCFLTEHKK